MPNRPMRCLLAALVVTAAAAGGPVGLGLIVLVAVLLAVAVEHAPERPAC